MKENEIKILRQLYSSPYDQNATFQELIRKLKINPDEFFLSISALTNNQYVKEITNDNQKNINKEKKNENLLAWEITVGGAIKIHDIDKQDSLSTLIKKYGNIISTAVAVLGIIGLIVQIYFGYQQTDLMSKQNNTQLLEYKLHLQEVKKDKANSESKVNIMNTNISKKSLENK